MPIVLRTLAVAAIILAALLPTAALADEGWLLKSFTAEITVQPDGTIDVVEIIEADFGALQKHGIFRDLRTRFACEPVESGPDPLFPCPEGKERVYQVDFGGVSDAVASSGRPVPFTLENTGKRTRIRIGDPDRLVSGMQAYRLTYRIRAALNAFDDHDELFWNVLSDTVVETSAVRVTVTLPAGTTVTATCFQGVFESTEGCRSNTGGNAATYEASRRLRAGEGLTVVAGWPRGVVAVPTPILEDRPGVADFFTFDAWELGGLGLAALLSCAGLARAWWRFGRDRRYTSVYYLTNDPRQETRPLFGRTDIVVEYLPPDRLRPAQMGVILDERADTLDVTATIIDLGVRGHLHITEIPKKGWFGQADWELEKKENADDELVPYEATLLAAVFESGEAVKVSSLKNKFAEDLARVKAELYEDAIARKWFARNPETSRTIWLVAGVATAAGGVLIAVAAGFLVERALVGLPLAIGGVVMLPLSRAMSRRTATGSEALRRVLGFRLYVDTAETRRQEFNEQQNIFARYLPFAIVFGCVDKWAKAFAGMDDVARASTASWYTGVGAFQVMAFTSGMRSFAGTVSTSIASTPGSSGGSGFSGGGFSGGGGGGGGGGSW